MKHQNASKWIGLCAVALLLMMGLACAQAIEEVSSAPQPVTTTEAPLATPVVEYTEPTVQTMPEGYDVPKAYSTVANAELPESITLFRFTDQNGSLAYRVFAAYDEMTNGMKTRTITGFYPSDETGVLLGTEAADPAQESYGQCTPLMLPENVRMRKAYMPTGKTGHFQSTDAEHPGYLVYGAFDIDDAAEGVFYPANADGAMIPGSLPIDYTVNVPAYAPTTTPEKDGDILLVIYVGTQSVVAYTAANGEWDETRVMVCSTGRKLGMTPEGEFNIVKQYVYKKLGMNGEDYRGQYSSRIVGNYLFHSVPIGGKNIKQDNGKKLMITKYYEQLGTPASGGCVRMRVIDAYWIYMHCTVGTPVHVVYSDGPIPEPPAKLIYEEPYVSKDKKFGWDPTDPDPSNPYHAIYPPELVLDGPVPDKSKMDAQEEDQNEQAGTY
ncbi:MAG: L,D-transpeptidase [Clostridia bacterium]